VTACTGLRISCAEHRRRCYPRLHSYRHQVYLRNAGDWREEHCSRQHYAVTRGRLVLWFEKGAGGAPLFVYGFKAADQAARPSRLGLRPAGSTGPWNRVHAEHDLSLSATRHRHATAIPHNVSLTASGWRLAKGATKPADADLGQLGGQGGIGLEAQCVGADQDAGSRPRAQYQGIK
jgi:hypothetical protein